DAGARRLDAAERHGAYRSGGAAKRGPARDRRHAHVAGRGPRQAAVGGSARTGRVTGPVSKPLRGPVLDIASAEAQLGALVSLRVAHRDLRVEPRDDLRPAGEAALRDAARLSH